MIDRTDERSKRSEQACLDNALQGGGRRESTKDEQYHEMLNNGEMYDSVDDEFIAYQHELVQRLNDFNRTDETPDGLKERDEILKEICGTYGEDLSAQQADSHWPQRVARRRSHHPAGRDHRRQLDCRCWLCGDEGRSRQRHRRGQSRPCAASDYRGR